MSDTLITVVFYSDPGHGWLQVPKHIAKEWKLAPSRYSYQDREYLYLEEDVDASLFIKACEERGIAYDIVNRGTNGRSFIRDLPSV